MITLIIGGSSSGKSKFAENLAQTNVTSSKKFYIATMLPSKSDIEVREKIKAHKKMREDKNFITCEYYTCESIIAHSPKSDIVLLECMSNLLANEMFGNGEVCYNGKVLEDVVVTCIKKLVTTTDHLIIVSNDIFHDGSDYDELTLLYISLLAKINQKLSKLATNVIEVVYSIPVQIKGENNYTL